MTRDRLRFTGGMLLVLAFVGSAILGITNSSRVNDTNRRLAGLIATNAALAGSANNRSSTTAKNLTRVIHALVVKKIIIAGQPGPSGALGIRGGTGPAGPAGRNGTNGLPGPLGLRGLQGLQGVNGANGPAGTGGQRGADGTPGADGATGAQGTTGVAGATGPVGPTGPAGSTGAQGGTGPAGAEPASFTFTILGVQHVCTDPTRNPSTGVGNGNYTCT